MIPFVTTSVGAALALLSAPRAMSIEEAAELAETRALSVRSQGIAVEQSRQRLAEGRASRGWQLSATGTYTRYSQRLATGAGAGGTYDARSATISAEVPIDLSGRLRDQVRSLDAHYRASRRTLAATINEAKLAAREAFIAVLRAQASVEVATRSISDAQAQLDQSESLYGEQSVALVDVMRYRAQLTQFKSDHVQRLSELQVARHAFNQTLALPPNTPVVLDEVPELPAVPDRADDLEREAMLYRPEVQALHSTLKAHGYTVRVAQAGLRPSLMLAANYQPNMGNAGFGAASNTGSATLTLSIPLFDSGITKARVAAARLDEDLVRIDLERIALAIAQGVRDAVVSQHSAKTRLLNSEEQANLAEQVYRLALVRREAGLGTYVDVIDAETSLAQARNAVVNARYDYLLGSVQLEYVVGRDSSRTQKRPRRDP